MPLVRVASKVRPAQFRPAPLPVVRPDRLVAYGAVAVTAGQARVCPDAVWSRRGDPTHPAAVLLSEVAAASDPAAARAVWQQAERYLGGGTRDYSRYAADLEISPRFHPQHGQRSFELPTFLIDPHRGRVLTSRVASTLPARYRRGDSFLLPVHPETLTDPAVRAQLAGCPAGPRLRVVPSANARTVFVEQWDGQPVEPHFVKLHYPKRLSRFTRRLRQPVIALHLWVAEELATIAAPVLPEVGGGVIGDDPAQAWGFLLREAAVPATPTLPYVLPLFALYGRDIRAPDHPTLLEQLILASGQPPAQWVCQRLIEPMLTLWARALLRVGCAIELHGQNTLLCLSADLRTTRIGYRDCAVYVDPAIRAGRGLSRPLPPRNVISRDITHPRGHVLSLVYDSFMGHHTLTYVASVLRRRFGVAESVLHRHARRVFNDLLTDRDLLPDTVYYYDDVLHPDGGWRLVDTGRRPCWR